MPPWARRCSGTAGIGPGRTEIARNPAQFGERRGKVGWFASAASREERAGAEGASRAVPDSLRRIHETTEHDRRGYVQEVQAQQNRDAVETSGSSKAGRDVLRDERTARLATEQTPPGDGYGAWQRRRDEAVAAAWQKGRADRSVAGERERRGLPREPERERQREGRRLGLGR